MRLQAFLARSGAAPSRRKAEAVISAGRVSVNGLTAELGAKVEAGDTVLLDGEFVRPPVSSAYYLLNKPEGYLTTMHDDRGRHTVSELMPGDPGIFPVGRLDFDTTGAILLTNDGDFANIVTHPSYEIPKEYSLTLENPVPESNLKALASGPTLDDGPMLPPRLTDISRHRETTSLTMTIHEGRNRIIRRACEATSLTLISLKRISVGPVRLGDLPPGSVRHLSKREVSAVRDFAREA